MFTNNYSAEIWNLPARWIRSWSRTFSLLDVEPLPYPRSLLVSSFPGALQAVKRFLTLWWKREKGGEGNINLLCNPGKPKNINNEVTLTMNDQERGVNMIWICWCGKYTCSAGSSSLVLREWRRGGQWLFGWLARPRRWICFIFGFFCLSICFVENNFPLPTERNVLVII